MSINMSASNPDQYADYHTQVLAAELEFEVDEETNNGDVIINTEPVSERGIDSNELAELVAMYRTFTFDLSRADEATQTEVCQGFGELTLGVNLGPDELPTRVTDVGQEITDDPSVVIVNEQDDADVFLANYEEPGVLDVSRSFAEAGFNEVGDGTGGPGSVSDAQERYVNFASEFGSGPFIDRTDDISIHIEAGVDNGSDGLLYRAEVQYLLYWAVHEAEGGRGAFARP